jgi:hypothetical protein
MIFISNTHKYACMHLYTCTHTSCFILLPICMAAMALCLLEYCASTAVEFLDSNQILTPNFLGVLYKVKKKALCGGHIHPSACILVSATRLLRHILSFTIQYGRLLKVVGQFQFSAVLIHNKAHFT